MPVYEYYCGDCETTFEKLRSMATINEPQPCATCGATHHVNRKLTTFARMASIEPGGGTESGGLALPMLGGGGCGCGGACSCG